MALPGTVVTTSAAGARRGLPTATGTLFVAAPFSAGTLGVVHQLDTFADYAGNGLGTRTGGATAVYDAIESYFAEGGSTVYAVRVGTGYATVAAALALLGPEYGPGQVIAPGDTTAHAALITHAVTNNRFAILDADGVGITIPPVSGSTTNRTAPASGAVAGRIARSDETRSPNQWPAGDEGYFRWVLDVQNAADSTAAISAATTLFAATVTSADYAAGFLAGHFTDAQRETLNNARVNVIKPGDQGVQVYGARTLSSAPEFAWAGNSRLRMYLADRLKKASEQFLFQQITPALIARARAVWLGVLDEEYTRGAIFGDSPDDAYDVDTSTNTTETIADGRLLGVATYKPSPTAERVELELAQTSLAATI